MYSIKLLILFFGLLIVVMAGLLMFRPKLLTDFMVRNAAATWMHVMAVAVRLIMGVALLLYASQSRFPLPLQIIGWIAIAAGVILALIPPARFKQLVTWAFERFGHYTRAAALAALVFGAFIIYAVL
jgi:hypothetical protein